MKQSIGLGIGLLLFSLTSLAQTVQIGALVSGQVVKVYVKPQQVVDKGQKLLEIDSEAYHARLERLQAQLAQEELKLTDAKIELEKQKDLYDRTVTAKRKLEKTQLAYDLQKQKVKAASAAVKAHQAWQKYYHIVAPVNGRIIKIFAPQGSTVYRENTPLMSLERR
ncbi:efflux RND transporter periplasmic adaptor subunit [Galenea microaerophila]